MGEHGPSRGVRDHDLVMRCSLSPTTSHYKNPSPRLSGPTSLLIRPQRTHTAKMRAYYMDNDPTDQRLPHDSGRAVSDEILDALGVLRWHIPVDSEGKWQSQVDAIADERHYKNRDVCLVTKEGMGEQFETNLKKFYSEYVMRSLCSIVHTSMNDSKAYA